MDIIYPVLAKKLKEKGFKLNEIEKLLGIAPKSLYNKLRGTTAFTWDEVSLIRNKLFPEMWSDELFRKEEAQ